MPGPATDHPFDQIEDFESYFRREHPRLLATAVALVGDREVARELVQEALLRTFNAWAKISRLERPGGWTRRVLVNLCTDVHRRRGSEQRALSLVSPSPVVESPALPSTAFWNAVRALPKLQRAVVALHYVDDLSVAEVADVLGVSSGTVKTSLMRARTALAPTLAVHRSEEAGS
jgi:RNA polymerase sigma-70 factor (ECF subfamily)